MYTYIKKSHCDWELTYVTSRWRFTRNLYYWETWSSYYYTHGNKINGPPKIVELQTGITRWKNFGKNRQKRILKIETWYVPTLFVESLICGNFTPSYVSFNEELQRAQGPISKWINGTGPPSLVRFWNISKIFHENVQHELLYYTILSTHSNCERMFHLIRYRNFWILICL